MTMLQVDQRSDEWFAQRLGRFTGSKASELLSNGKTSGSVGAGFETLCIQKANEIVFGRDEQWDALAKNWDVKRGTDLEPEAFEFLKMLLAQKFITLEVACFFPYGSDGGASPDGIAGKNKCAEIKCPRPEKIFDLIRTGEIDKDHFNQMQYEMLATNSISCYYFNYAIWKGNPIYHLIEVEADEVIQQKIIELLPKAVKRRDEIVDELRKNIQFKIT